MIKWTRRLATVLIVLAFATRWPAGGAAPLPSKPRHAVVSGLSIVGLVATATLAKLGYTVDAFELRGSYTRNIQWAGRQALVDELASLDSKLAWDFVTHIGAALPRGSLHLSEKGRGVWPVDAPQKGDAARIPATGEELMGAPSLMNMEARVFEQFLFEYVKTVPGVTIHRPGTVELAGPAADGSYAVKGYGTPDLVVIAEGAGSTTRTALKIRACAASPKREQVAGALTYGSGGAMTKHYHRDASGELLLTGVMGRSGANRTWIVADLPFGPSAARTQAQLDRDFRSLAAAALEVPVASLSTCELLAPADTQGGGARTFSLQQHIASSVTAGSNVVLIGDAARNGHWSVGGGMQTGAIADVEALKRLVRALQSGTPRATALAAYSDSVFANSCAWLRRGISDFYPELDRNQVSDAFMAAVTAWRAGKVESPLAALEAVYPRGGRSTADASVLAAK